MACADFEARQDEELIRAVEAAEALQRLRSQLDEKTLSKLAGAEAAVQAKTYSGGAVADPAFQAKEAHLKILKTLQDRRVELGTLCDSPQTPSGARWGKTAPSRRPGAQPQQPESLPWPQ